MGVSYSSSSIENLKNQVNIVDVVGRVVSLKKAGSNYKGVCPFHNEKTPSFVVSEQKQIFTCFGCGASGDMIAFVERYYNLGFSEAVEKIADEYGITLEKNHYNDNNDIYYKVNKMAAAYFYKTFTQKANKGYSYMKKRGITPQILKKFGIGYADEQWDSLYKYLLSQGIDKKIMLELGLISESKGHCYDKFRNRVMFPIINTGGKVIGFGGRAISPDDNPKYLNSPESRVFQKKNNLYGLNLSRQSVGKDGFIILVEGYMDVIGLYQSGVENVAASLGTALTENQAGLIKRYTREVVLSYDADGAGRKAALRGMDILKSADCKVKVLHVTDGKDPDEYVKKNGKDAYLSLVNDALTYGEYKLEAAKSGFDLSKDDDRIDYIKKAAVILKSLSPVEQEIYIKKLSGDINISEGAIRMELLGNDSTEKKAAYAEKSRKNNDDKTRELSSLEKTILKVIISDEAYLKKLDNYPGIIKSDLATGIINIIKEETEQSGSFDIKGIMDRLDAEDAVQLQNILDQVILGGNEKSVFDECIRTWRDSELAEEEHRLITLLSIADEESNTESVKKLSEQLLKVQQKRNINRKQGEKA